MRYKIKLIITSLLLTMATNCGSSNSKDVYIAGNSGMHSIGGSSGSSASSNTGGLINISGQLNVSGSPNIAGAGSSNFGGQSNGGELNISGQSNGGNLNVSGSSNMGGSVGTTKASVLASKIGRKTNFLIGMGNDLNEGGDHSKDEAYLLGPTLDLHYAYLVGLMGNGGWPDWNTNGGFVDILTSSADAKGVTPMFTLYSMAAYGDGNLAGLSDDKYMKPYFDGLKLLYKRLAAFNKPAVIHLEPDFWAYAEIQSNENPASIKVRVNANAPDCTGLSDDLIGLGNCMIKMSRQYSPKVMIGFHASNWASSDPKNIITFLKTVGADKADMIISDMLDRDAGCFEAGTDPNCTRSGEVYWDESNTTSPNFHEYLAWSKTIATGLNLPILWWQVPFGVPNATKGGTSGHYRDNRVHYIFSHIQEFIDAGGVGVTFGTGAANQTTPSTDNGQFKSAVTTYFARPLSLP